MSLEDTYRNPFSDYNANTMNIKQVVEYWENPFNTYLAEISEEDIKWSKSPIVFTGGRGSGKTHVFKYFGIDAMKQRAETNNRNIYDAVIDEKYIGIYIRFDGPQLQNMQKTKVEEEQWIIIFTHYFELVIAESFLTSVYDLLCAKSEPDRAKMNTVVQKYEELFHVEKQDTDIEKRYKNLVNTLGEDINYVAHFKSRAAFGNKDFKPREIYVPGQLSNTIIDIFNAECFPDLDINYLLLIDEYENFLDYQQTVINSYLKFYNKFAYRIGMRPYGFHSYATVSENEFIKEGRDYRECTLVTSLIGKKELGGSFFEFLKKLAEKRLRSISYFANKDLTDIKKILGNKEDYVCEAQEIVKGKKTHFDEYIKEIKKEYKKNNIEYTITDEQMKKLEDDTNPLYEVQNLHLLLKPNTYDYVLKAFNDYKNGIDSKEAQKYKNDYLNKYKLSYVFILCSIYKVKYKKYYGFTDYAFLSSGFVGTFIELCRNAFQRAYYNDSDQPFSKIISSDIQTLAAKDVANQEFKQINRISNIGDNLLVLTRNIGTQFRKRHTDKRIRYPETNQFAVKGIETREAQKYISAAIQWSVFQQKKDLQQESIGKSDVIIYTLNRVYSPIFQISVRTRGGFNESYSYDDIIKMATEDTSNIEVSEPEKTIETEDDYHQLSIEEYLSDYE